MEKRTTGAWLLAHSRNLDHVSGDGAARLERILYAGKVGRLYNVLRRNVQNETTHTIGGGTVADLCQLNGIDLAARRDGLAVLQTAGRIDLTKNGSVAVLGATTAAVLETAAEIFDANAPTPEERAVLELSEIVADRPIGRADAESRVSDGFKIKQSRASDLVDLCKRTALVDEEASGDNRILFNSNTFRDKGRARKAYYVLEGLRPSERKNLTEVEELLHRKGTATDAELLRILGNELHRRLVSIGYFDQMEVINTSEAVTYVALPDAFQRYGRPFEEDPVDDAKALIASLTYGMTRSDAVRGSVTMPIALLNALINGRTVGGQWGVRAIGEDYKELERRGTVSIRRISGERYQMKLLKRDVGELALAIITGGGAAEQALLLATGGAAVAFKGPAQLRSEVREKNTVKDREFVTDALDRIRSGG